MRGTLRALRNGSAWVACLLSVSCGGNNLSAVSKPPPASAPNVVAVVVDGGPSSGNINKLYATVTVCSPGSTTDCQTIEDIQVDTGSYGLRLISQALTLSLPVTKTANGTALLECLSFADGYSWGPVALVDVTISGESAKSVPVQLIGDKRYPTVPADCASSAPMAEDSVAAFGANGLLGIGPLRQDCGTSCVNTVVPGTYYSCTSAACTGTTVALASQVTNPVTFFAADNNGSIIELPSIAAAGAASVSGSLIFGIDTESNNQLGSKTVFTLDATTADLTTIYRGQTLTSSFIDSGSNGYFFEDASIAPCTESGLRSFYCPASSVTLNAVIQGQNNVTTGVSFTVVNIEDALGAQPLYTAFPGLAGPNVIAGSFDWGLPFFFGRPIATAIEGSSTSQGSGPFVAF